MNRTKCTTAMVHILCTKVGMPNRKRKITIGILSKETGIPIPTLHTWERRYGFPTAERTDGKHRLYDPEVIPHLQAISFLREQGHRVSQLLVLSKEDIDLLLEQHSNANISSQTTIPVPQKETQIIQEWLQATRNLDDKSLLSQLQISLSTLGLEKCIVERVVPFLELLGNAWVNKEIQIFHEHFASHHLLQFVQENWQLINANNTGKVVVISTLPTETHIFGLHLVACMLVLQGYKVVMLGNNTPVVEIAKCAEQVDACGIALSFSHISEFSQIRQFCLELQHALHSNIPIVIGGSGVKEVVEGMQFCGQLQEVASFF